ncbi:hypothetical protein Q31a_50170 [Aureliella helgolandensis]|uniref:Uncharacterized protein n=1 Tax=Aureliella helgolandensis TaxID=2527968 RepID=A0A518GDG7_9BACT|nr:hypothetical protein Q31a_50170 [Aureliella helgolandensis]
MSPINRVCRRRADSVGPIRSSWNDQQADRGELAKLGSPFARLPLEDTFFHRIDRMRFLPVAGRRSAGCAMVAGTPPAVFGSSPRFSPPRGTCFIDTTRVIGRIVQLYQSFFPIPHEYRIAGCLGLVLSYQSAHACITRFFQGRGNWDEIACVETTVVR